MNDLFRSCSMMIDAISLYRLSSDVKQLGNLVQRLEEILSVIKPVDADAARWKQEVLGRWGVLEDVYADALYRKYPKIPEERMKILESSIGEIERLVNEKKSPEKKKQRGQV